MRSPVSDGGAFCWEGWDDAPAGTVPEQSYAAVTPRR